MANYMGGKEADIITQVYLPLIASAAIIFTGLLTQSFVVTMNVIDWLKQKSMTVTDQIITSLCAARFFFYVSRLMYLCNNLFTTKLFLACHHLTGVVWDISNYSSIWLSALLSFFFWLKISTFRHAFLVRLKAILSQKVVYLITASVLLSVLYTSMKLLTTFWIDFRNATEEDHIDRRGAQAMYAFYLLCNFLPLLVYFATSVLLSISLSVHLRRMKNSSNAMNGTGTYCKIITFTVASLLTWVFYVMLNVFRSDFLALFGWEWLSFMGNFFQILLSVYLICVTTKTKNQFLWALHCANSCLSTSKASETDSRVPVEMTDL